MSRDCHAFPFFWKESEDGGDEGGGGRAMKVQQKPDQARLVVWTRRVSLSSRKEG